MFWWAVVEFEDGEEGSRGALINTKFKRVLWDGNMNLTGEEWSGGWNVLAKLSTKEVWIFAGEDRAIVTICLLRSNKLILLQWLKLLAKTNHKMMYLWSYQRLKQIMKIWLIQNSPQKLKSNQNWWIFALQLFPGNSFSACSKCIWLTLMSGLLGRYLRLFNYVAFSDSFTKFVNLSKNFPSSSVSSFIYWSSSIKFEY